MEPSNQDEGAWYAEICELLEEAYLSAEDPRGQSGFRGDRARWERARRPIVSAIDNDGTFLDVGCANGLLMEDLSRWTAETGYRIEPYGLDLIESLATLARRRLPRWSERIFAGNVIEWQPPFRFDFVRTNLEYVPPHQRREMVERLLREYLTPGGRLIACSYGSSRQQEPRAEPIGDILRGWSYTVAGEAEGTDANGVAITRVAWIDGPCWKLEADR